MLFKLQSQSKLLGHFAVQWRIQGRGQGEPGSPLIFKPNWGPKGRKNFFETIPPPPPYLRVWMTAPPPPAPHLIWRSGSAIAVFLPSQCWYTRFGELTAINKIGRTRRWARSWKNSVGLKFSNYFCRRLALDTIQDWLRKVKLLRRWVLLLNENEWHNSTETANHDINWPMSTQLKNTISFSGRKTSYKYYYGRQENNDNIIFIQEWTIFLYLRMKNRV